MSIPATVISQLRGLAVGQATIEGDLKVLVNKHDNLQEDVDLKHHANVSAIEELKLGLKAVADAVGRIRTKLAVWTAIGGLISGAITAIAIEVIRVLAERYFK